MLKKTVIRIRLPFVNYSLLLLSEHYLFYHPPKEEWINFSEKCIYIIKNFAGCAVWTVAGVGEMLMTFCRAFNISVFRLIAGGANTFFLPLAEIFWLFASRPFAPCVVSFVGSFKDDAAAHANLIVRAGLGASGSVPERLNSFGLVNRRADK